MNPLNIFRRLHSGTVIAKNHYAPSGVEKQTETNFNKGALMVTTFAMSAPIPESWSLVVRGTDKSGKHQLVKEIYVDPLSWSTTSIGSSWPPASA